MTVPALPIRLLLFPLLLLMGSAAGLWAQPPAVPPLTVETVEAETGRWSAATLDPELKKRVLALADDALERVRRSGVLTEKARQFRQDTAALPDQAKALRQDADRPDALPENLRPPKAGAPLEPLESSAAQLQEALEASRRAADAAKDLPLQQANRRKELTALINTQTELLLKLRAGTVEEKPGQAPALTEAEALVRKADQAAAAAQLEAAKAEMVWLDAAEANDWLALQVAQANRRQETIAAALADVRSRLDQLRSRTATKTLETAIRSQAAAPAELRPVLEAATRNAVRNQEVIESLIPEAESRLDEIEAGTRHWLEVALRTREKIRRLGASGVVGMELRQQRQALPSLTQLNQGEAARRDTMNEVELARLALDEQLAALPAPPEKGTPQAAAVTALRESIATLQQTYSRYFNLLLRLEEAWQHHRTVVGSHRNFIHENILWMPSTLPAGRESLASIGTSVKWMGSGLGEPGLFASWWHGVGSMPVISGITVVGLGVLFFIRHLGRRRLSALARLAARPDPGFSPTAAALVWTVAIALPWPVLLWSLALPWLENPASSAFALIVAAALIQTALALLGLELVRQPLRPEGLAEAHFGWPHDMVRQLRWQFRRLLAILVPAVFTGSLFQLSDEIRHDPAERVCLVLGLLAAAWWLHRFWITARRHAGIPAASLNRLFWKIGHAACILLPLVLSVLALRGYLFTAETLTQRLGVTLMAGAGFLTVRALFLRWYALHRRQLRASRARQLREAREASRAAQAAAGGKAAVEGPAAEFPMEPDPESATGSGIDENGQEMRGLVDIVVFISLILTAWSIWSEVLPAAKSLADRPLDALVNTVTDKTAAAGSDKKETAASPAPAPADSSGKEPSGEASSSGKTTLLGVLMAAAAAVLTIMASQRIPGALQFVLTSQLNLDPGARFALGTVTRYGILIAGIVYTCSLLGINWSSIHWFAAALTVGLGFGLQEIFANFFSGLIILLERPIRPGDTVTIDNITGIVTRIRIRATTIRAPDGKDYIVPNKEFITGKLLNWTLTDTMTRQEIAVGIEYGADPAAAMALLKKIALDHPMVLKEPGPVVTFEGFGETALQLRLRFHVSTIEQRLPTLTGLYTRIFNAFREAGIGLPYLPRELHVHPSSMKDPAQYQEKSGA